MAELARRPNVFCKLSGVVTEAGSWWNAEQIRPYLEVALNAFGPKRVMFGSDWPVCLVAVDYSNWCGVVADFVSKLSDSEQQRVWSGTASEAYRLVA
jgi:L-fuconolactonase